jgi:hypothetical protein
MKNIVINRCVARAVLGCTVLASFAADSATAGSVAILTSGSSVTPAGWSNLAWNYVGLAATKNTGNTDSRMAGIRQGGGVDILYRFNDDGNYYIYPMPGITRTYSSITADRVTGDRFYASKPGGGVDVISAVGGGSYVATQVWSGTYGALAASKPQDPPTTTDRVWATLPTAGPADILFYYQEAFGTYTEPSTITNPLTSWSALTTDPVTYPDYVYAAKPAGGVDIFYSGAVFSNQWSGTYSGLAADSFTYQSIAAIKPGGGADLLTVSGSAVTTPQAAWSDTYTAITASQVNGGQFFAAVVPEPSTYALLLGGAAAAALVRRRKR